MKKSLPTHNQGSIQQELLRALRYHRPLSLLAITAEYSTTPSLLSAGTRFHDILRKHLRNTDIVAEDTETRVYLLLPETPIEGSLILANRLVRDLVSPEGLLKSLHIGLSAIDEGVYRADDLISTAIISNMAAQSAGRPIFSIATFRDKSLSLSAMVAVALNLPVDDLEELSAFLERTRHEPEGIRKSASELAVRLSKKLKLDDDTQEIVRFWILMHDLPRNTTPAPAPDEILPHLSRRKKAFHTSLMNYSPLAENPAKREAKARALLDVFTAVLQEIETYHNPTQEIFEDILRKVVARCEDRGMDKQVLALVRKTSSAEWFSYPS
ncbi:MAG: hypothetical protein D084_Lepto4C00288G0002 [Leptospirillum sp. Group IV 'UBA BS']|nr:MAG: hypothetical protein D084_Lepto4C00288G0002 [Leptospirillum sp. Group IV 'UBA BS']